MTYVFCQCKIHCAQYNQATNTYTGGQLVTRTTAVQHRADENRSTAHGIFSANITTSILQAGPFQSPQDPHDHLRGSSLERESLDQQLLTLEHEVDDRCGWTPTNQWLVFALDPIPDEPFQPPVRYNGYTPNSGTHALDPSHPSNLAFIENENRLIEILIHLENMAGPEDLRERLADAVQSGLQRMWSHKESEWNRQRRRTAAAAGGHGIIENGKSTFTCNKSEIDHLEEKYLVPALPQNPVVAIVLMTVVLVHLVFHLPQRASRVLIAGIRSMLIAQGADRRTLEQIPIDPRTFVKRLTLDPKTSTFLQCPGCYALYPYTGVVSSSLPDNHCCNHRATPSSPPCNIPLFERRQVGGRNVYAPRRKYVHQGLKEWVGRLLARPGVEELLKEPCNRPESPTMEDIWDSPVLRNFRDIDQESFFRGRNEDLRLAFSLNADGFNPLHMLESKQTLTCTAIYLVVLNFPPHLRYLFRNMYLAGVIPGPGKPSLDQINHVLSIVVAELLEFWKGIFYTVTSSSPLGRFVKGVLIPLVCDMLAARQLAGFSSATSTFFCTFCLTTIHDIEDLNKAGWPLRDLSKHLHYAKLWKDSASEADRQALFRKHGIRWSALLDLPYWNPILFSVVDTMHSTYLGMIHSHCRRIWGTDISVEGGDGSVLQSKKSIPRPPDHVLTRWLNAIREAEDLEVLKNLLSTVCTKDTLWHICVDNGIRSAGGRKQMAQRIAEWVSFDIVPDSSQTEFKTPEISGGSLIHFSANSFAGGSRTPPAPSRYRQP